ncbi:MAG: bacteriocin [Prolixibacteraceae bacterium]|nr:bacteriocin [Prolixibacteraceae bacterium]
MNNLETKGFKELSCEELKEVQGGMKWWQALLGFAASLAIGFIFSGGDMTFDI